MANNPQTPQNDPRQAQTGRENSDKGRDSMERPETDDQGIERERRERDKRPQ
jgi:hypothetical protein